MLEPQCLQSEFGTQHIGNIRRIDGYWNVSNDHKLSDCIY